jgi:ubiquinone/menaquinone biosynthesis C-methylase UbiE
LTLVTDVSTRKEFFNQSADNWDKHFQTQELNSFLEQFVPTFGIDAGQRVLDVGAGTGVIIPFLLNAVGSTGHVTAIDFAEEMTKKCRAKFGPLPNVTVMVKDVVKLDFEAGSFDAVVCFGVFPHFENKEEALRQIHRALKPGGKLVIAHALSSAEIEEHHHNASLVIAHDFLPNRVAMKSLLRQAGFIGARILDEPGRYLCTSNKPQK